MAGYTPNCASTTTQTTVQANQSNYITVNGKQVLKQYFSQDQRKTVYAHIDPSGIGGVVYKPYPSAQNTTQQKPNNSNLPQNINQSQVQTRVIYRKDAYGRTYKVLQKFIPAQPKQNPIDKYSPSAGGAYKPESDTRKPEDFPLPLVKQKGTKDPSEDSNIDVQRKAPNSDSNIAKPPSREEVQPKIVNDDEKPSNTPFVNGSKAPPALNSKPEFSSYAILKPHQKLAKPIMTEKGAASFSVTNNSSKEITIERKANRFGDYEYRASYLGEDLANPGKMKRHTYDLGGNYKYDNKFNHSTYNFGSDRHSEVRLNNRDDKKFYSNLPRESDKDLTPRTDIELAPGKDSVSYLYPKGSPNSTKTVIVDGHKLLLTNESSGGFAYVISRQQKDGSFKTYISTDSSKAEEELKKGKYISNLNIEDLGKTEAQIKLDDAAKLLKEQEIQKARSLEEAKFNKDIFGESKNKEAKEKSPEELPAPSNQKASGDLKKPESLDDLFGRSEEKSVDKSGSSDQALPSGDATKSKEVKANPLEGFLTVPNESGNLLKEGFQFQINNDTPNGIFPEPLNNILLYPSFDPLNPIIDWQKIDLGKGLRGFEDDAKLIFPGE